MSLDRINSGTLPNDGTGDTDRTAFQKADAAIGAVNTHLLDNSNPHGVTAAQVGAYTIGQTNDALTAAIVKITAGTLVGVAINAQGQVVVTYKDLSTAIVGSAVGPAGTPGSVLRNGSGAPASALGINGDYYLNTTSGTGAGDLYLKASGAYTKVSNLAGPITSLAIGTVSTLAPGSAASATITGTAPNQVLNLALPQGSAGINGTGSGTVTTTGSPAASQVAVFSGSSGTVLAGAASLPAAAFPALTGDIQTVAGSLTTVLQASATSRLSTFQGDSGSGGVKGLVPAPASGDAAAKFLSAAGGWAVPTANSTPVFTRMVRQSGTQIGAADAGKWYGLNFTAAQLFDSPANLGPQWSIILDIVGANQITIPSSDGVTNWIMYPGEVRIFFCDGTAITSKVLNPFYATFTASGTFVTPPGYALFSGFIWGGGASGVAGGSGTVAAVGGGGAAATPFHATSATLGASQSATIGAGGVGSNSSIAAVGGNSTLGAIATGYAGSIAPNSISTSSGIKAFTSGNAYDPFSGGVGSTATGNGNSIYGAGAGAYAPAGGPNAPGTSVFGGSGGLGTLNGTAGNGNAPGGGGGGSYNGISGSGARGELRIWGVV